LRAVTNNFWRGETPSSPDISGENLSDSAARRRYTFKSMTSDLDLLGQYAQKDLQDAFTEIVRRHVDLVYSAALRQVRSPQLAEEVAQSVFADLARNAGKISGTGVPPASSLTPWLYSVTRRTAIDVVRKESRRQIREQIAVEMNMNATAENWTQIEPLLDEAMHVLDETDRSAVLLRYFENKSLREIGATLGTSDDAAQKRVSRAVERLREFFSKRNVTIGAGGLTVLISANAVQAAPVGLAATISTAAILTGTTFAAITTATAIKTVAMTTLQKTLIVATLATAVGTGIYETHQASTLRGQNQLLQQQQAPLAEQLRQLQQEHDDATNRLAAWLVDNDPQRLRKEHLELLSLRGQVAQLAGELRGRKVTGVPFGASPSPESVAKAADSIILTAALATNRIASGNTLVMGGWPLMGRRGYLLISPVIVPGDTVSGGRQIAIQSQVIQAPESFWDEIGWGSYKSETHRSTLAGELTPDQVGLLIQALNENQDAHISKTPLATIADGKRMGYGYSKQEDDGTGGALMGVDFYPRISADGRAVNLEIIPTPVTANTPIHPSLKSAGQLAPPSGD